MIREIREARASYGIIPVRLSRDGLRRWEYPERG
jgi:hypothetical protein